MNRFLVLIKNKYIISATFVVVYILVLHDSDILTLVKRNERVALLEKEIDRKKIAIERRKEAINGLQDIRSLEKYARENHYFKKADEDIFIFSFE